jgi:hypothetical protein
MSGLGSQDDLLVQVAAIRNPQSGSRCRGLAAKPLDPSDCTGRVGHSHVLLQEAQFEVSAAKQMVWADGRRQTERAAHDFYTSDGSVLAIGLHLRRSFADDAKSVKSIASVDPKHVTRAQDCEVEFVVRGICVLLEPR